MTPPTVAVVAPGDMGHAVGRVLVDHGVRVVTALAGRSARTAELAAKAGIADLGDDRALLDQSDMLLSILPPARAVDSPNASPRRFPRSRGRSSMSTAMPSRPRPSAGSRAS